MINRLLKYFLFLLVFLFSLNVVSAVDFDNITFTNEEFLGSAVTNTAITELSNGKLAVAYGYASGGALKICDLDGTNCGSENLFLGAALNTEGLSIFEDVVNEEIHVSIGYSGNGHDFRFNLSGTTLGNIVYNSGSTSYVSAVQTNLTHSAIAYQDTADGNKDKLIFCTLDGSSCGSETQHFGTVTYNVLKMTSDNLLTRALVSASTGNLFIVKINVTTQTLVGIHQTINPANSAYPDFTEGSDNKLKIVFQDTADGSKGKFVSADLDGTNPSSEIDINGGRITQFLSLVEIPNEEKLVISAKYRNTVPADVGGIRFINLTGGELSNVSLTYGNNFANLNDIIFTSDNTLVNSAYGSASATGVFAISEAFPSGATVTINNPIENEFLNNLNFTLNVTTDLNTNLTYSLNGASNITLGTNINSSVSTITGIEGTNNITVYSNFSSEITNSGLRTFTIDTLNPNLTVTLPNEYNAYLGFNFSNFITYSDTNLDTCIVLISGESSTTCNQTNYNFTTNGNKTINITVTDLAGNSNSSLNNLMLVNPYQRFHFHNGTGLVSNFTFGGETFLGTEANFTVYNDILTLGSNTLLFEKLGYVSENFTFNINTTSDINITYNVTAAQIIVNIFNRETGAVFLLSTDVNVFGLGNQSTSTGQAIFQDYNFVPGEYSVEAISTGYYTEHQTFTYSGESNSIINLYLLDFSLNNSATLIVPTTDEWDNVLGGVDVRLQEYDTSILGFKQVSQCLSNSNGECQFLVEQSTKSYRIIGTIIINSITYTATNPLDEDGETFLPIISGGEEILGLDIVRQLKLKISDTLPPANFLGLTITAPVTVAQTLVSQNSTTTVINVPIDFLSTSGLSYTVCFDVFVTSGSRYTSVITPICTTGASGVLPTANVSLNNDFDYEAVITVEYDGIKETFRTYPYPNNKTFGQILLNDALVPNAVMFFWTILLALSMYMRNLGLWSWGAMFLAVAQLGFFANLLVLSSSVIIIVINGCVLYVSKKTVDA